MHVEAKNQQAADERRYTPMHRSLDHTLGPSASYWINRTIPSPKYSSSQLRRLSMARLTFNISVHRRLNCLSTSAFIGGRTAFQPSALIGVDRRLNCPSTICVHRRFQ